MKITRIKSTLTAPDGIALVVVKVETDQPGLYGLGCATFTQRPTLVAKAVNDYLDPLLRGRNAGNIEDLWHMMHVNSYWRNGPVLNNAISGVDMALWDIKGKVADMPLHDLLGGKSREAAMVYCHADGRDRQEVLDNVLEYQAAGMKAIRCQMGGYGARVEELDNGAGPQATHRAYELDQMDSAFPGAYYNPKLYVRETLNMLEYVRAEVGHELHMIHDVHERLTPSEAITFAKAAEATDLFFLEDPLPPDQIPWLRRLRQQCATPIALGELHNNPLEWRPLIVEQLIDFIRSHVSQLGGVTPARKLAVLCEAFGVQTAWHGPGDTSPLGHAANLHLNLVSHNFGIHEMIDFSDSLREVFPGTPELRSGYLHANEKPGLGIDFNEDLAAKYPVELAPITWTQCRRPDGTIWTP